MKSKFVKRSSLTILALALVLSTVLTRAQSVQAAPVAPGFGPVVVRWFIGLGTGTDASQIPVEMQVASDFNHSQSKITLVPEFVPNATARDTLAHEIGSGSAPDIVGPVGWIGSNTFKGQWLDLAPLIASTNFNTGIFPTNLVNMYKTDEGQVGLPFAIYPSAMYYNPALFDAAHLNYPPTHYGDQYEMPDTSMVYWNWDTLAQVSKLLTLDNTGKNSTQDGFDVNNIVQYGFSFGYEGNPNYWGSYWHAGTILHGTTPGSYTAVIPAAWKAAWQWVYDGMWGAQPYYPSVPVANSSAFDNGNVFASGKVAMLDNPSWIMCCLGDLTGAGGTFQMGAMPTYNGVMGGRMDADSFRIFKGTAHPNEAFQVLSYLLTTGVDKLIIGSETTPAPYAALPAYTAKQQAFWDAKAAQFPFVTTDSWNILKAGLNYPDVPSAESYMPNINTAWDYLGGFGNTLGNVPGLDLATEEASLQTQLAIIFNQYMPNFYSTGSQDGWILESAKGSKVGGSINATSTTLQLGDDASNRQYRSILSFNTAGLPDNAIILSAVLKIDVSGAAVGSNPFSVLGNLYVDIKKGNFGTNSALQTTDFNAAASVNQVASFGKTPVGGWYTATLNQTGYPYINTTGLTQFRLYFSTPTNANSKADYLKFVSGEVLRGKPQLIISYLVP